MVLAYDFGGLMMTSDGQWSSSGGRNLRLGHGLIFLLSPTHPALAPKHWPLDLSSVRSRGAWYIDWSLLCFVWQTDGLSGAFGGEKGKYCTQV